MLMRLAAGLAGLGLLAQVAVAEADSSSTLHWTLERDQIGRVDSADAGHATNFYSFTRIIRSTGATGPVVLLSCQVTSTGVSSLNTAIQIDPDNKYEENPSRTLHLLRLSATLTIGDEKKVERFQYHPESTKIVPFNRTIPKRLFNAVLTGAQVTLKVKGKTHDVELPGQDDAFVAFARSCPITNGGSFDDSIFEAARVREAAEK